MASLSLSLVWHNCIPNSRITKQAPLPQFISKNSLININQANFPKSNETCRKILDNAASGAHKPLNVKVHVASHNSIEQIQPGVELNYSVEELDKKCCYLFRTELGGQVKVLVGIGSAKYVVHIEVSSLPHYLSEHEMILSWGMFRSDSSHLYVPDSTILGFIKSPFTRNSLGKHTIALEFDINQIPFYLSFLLYSSFNHEETDSCIRTHRKTNFCVPVGLSSGHPLPLGVSKSIDGSTNFAIFSKNAENVILCLYNSCNVDQASLEIELDPYVNRTGDIWHVSMENIGNYISYGYRCKGEIIWDNGNRFHARHVLLDPYSKLIGNFYPDQGESVSLVKCLGSLAEKPRFDWSGDVHPQLPMEKLFVYRLNVGDFTKDNSSALPESIAGTFAGVGDKLQHFIDLGVNAVLLQPIFTFDEQKGPYFPYHYFSPMNSYGSEYEMKEMVKALHANGIEVMLEVVFTNTSEGGDAACQTISFRGIDNSSYYLISGDLGSGTNNAVNCNNPIVQQLIIESLRYWLIEFHVDGFCFINSSYLLHGSNGEYLSRPPLIEAIAFDPLLSKTKLIADCWSPIDNSYLDSHFPHWKRWAEMNTRFSRDVRNFLRGEGLLSDFATRLCGSGDIFWDSRGPSFSLNYVTKNSCLPLVDLVSFSSNDHASELSWNCGVEGPTIKKSVLEIRLRQIRNFLFVLFVSLGVPVLNMGEECGFSTGGKLSYVDRQPIDWSGLKTAFGKQITQFIAFLSLLRARRNDIFQKGEFLKVENIEWYGSDLSQPKWEDPSSKFLAMTLRAENDDKNATFYKGDIFICFNASDIFENAILPHLPDEQTWIRLADTSLPFPGYFSRDSGSREALSTYEVQSHSCALFEAHRSVDVY